MEKVVERTNLVKAYKRVCSNRGAPGVDGMKVEMLKSHLKQNWAQIKQALLTGSYKPKPVRRIEIPKPSGGIRLLGIPTVLDRFIQQAILQILTPIFDPLFSNHSYGFRPRRSAHQAVQQAQRHINEKKNIVVDIDLEKFFDQVNHDILMVEVAKQVKDVRMIKAIRRYLQAGVMINGVSIISEEGTPQGGPLSPLLANIILDNLDKELEKRNHKFVRYADDCNIYVASKRAGERVYQSIKRFVEKKLKLKVNEAKSAVDSPLRRTFLGFSFYRSSQTNSIKLRVASQAITRFKEKIRRITNRSNAQSMTERICLLKEYITGWGGYFAKSEDKRLLENLDQWTRRRLRMCLLKQWKSCKTKLNQLLKHGAKREVAAIVAYSRKKYWRLSNMQSMNYTFNLRYWKEQGLVSILDIYNKLRMPV